MEEDIKMLEWSQQQMRLGNLPDYNQKVYKAIENLINRNKELEKQIDLEYVEENYIEKSKVIPKSKVEEKIKELKYQTLYINGITDKKETEIASVGALMGKIQVLEELLEE